MGRLSTTECTYLPTFRNDVDGHHHKPCRQQRSPPLPTSNTLRRPNRPRTEHLQIHSIPTPTQRTRLAAMNAHAGPAEHSASSSSNIPGPEKLEKLAPMHQHPLRKDTGDAGGATTPIGAQTSSQGRAIEGPERHTAGPPRTRGMAPGGYGCASSRIQRGHTLISKMSPTSART